MTNIMQDAEALLKKDVENEAHPIVKQVWTNFQGDYEAAKAWLDAEWKKIEAKLD